MPSPHVCIIFDLAGQVPSSSSLHLMFHAYACRLAMDASGTSDPYIEVYVNDVQRARGALLV